MPHLSHCPKWLIHGLAILLLLAPLQRTLSSEPVTGQLLSFEQIGEGLLSFSEVGNTGTFTTIQWIPVEITFYIDGIYHDANTTVNGRLEISGVAGASGYYGEPTGKYQMLQTMSFSLFDEAGAINYLSGTIENAFISQIGSTLPNIDSNTNPGGTGWGFTSDSFIMNAANASNEKFYTHFTPAVGFMRDTNNNGVMDSTDFNGIVGNVTASVLTSIPEPSSALFTLLGMSSLLMLHRRRAV